LSDAALFTVAMGRHDATPWGVGGGQRGSPNYVEIHYGDGRVSERFGKATALALTHGDLIRIVTGTGGGWGPPQERSDTALADDVRNGYSTVELVTLTYRPGTRESVDRA
jgi:N-methylhydantoinase B